MMFNRRAGVGQAAGTRAMLFRQRQPDTKLARLRYAVWPRRSFPRSMRYFIKRVLRLSASPHAVAAGVAAGVFSTFTPFIGAHILIAVLIAWSIGGNLIAAALGTMFGNPLTFPLIWTGALGLGRFLLNTPEPEEGDMDLGDMVRELELTQLWEPFIKPMMVGGAPLGLATAMAVYFLTRWSVNGFRERRRARLAEQARARAGKID